MFWLTLESPTSELKIGIHGSFVLKVALGQCNELLEANPKAEGLLQGKHSTKGLGKMAPNPTHFVTL